MKVYELEEIMKGIIKELEVAEDGGTLTQEGHKLSVYNISLGAVVADWKRKADLLENTYKAKEVDSYIKYRNSGDSVADSQAKSRNDSFGDRENFITASGEYMRLRNFYDQINQEISFIQTRVGWLKSEIGNQTLEIK